MHRILIIDDDEDVRSLLCEVLRRDGLEVVSASGGGEGLQKFHQNNPTVVVTDLSMPDRSGYYVMREIHRVCPTAKIIVISGSDHETWSASATQSGAFAVLPKPFTNQQFLKTVKLALPSS